MAQKQQYQSLPGKDGGEPEMANKGEPVVLSQPTKLSATEEYVLNLDPNEVAGWSVQEVVQNFLERAGLGYMAEQFTVNKINGKCLMLLTEGHLHELGITCLGDRIYLTELIGLLKKKKREADLSAAKWSGVTPAPGIAYKEDCGECCLAYLCPCCLAKTYWRVTGQGVFYKRVPPCGLWMEVRTEYMDYRFFKDLELKTTRTCLCCCTATELEMYVDDHDATAAKKEGDPPNTGAFYPHVLRHPEARHVEQVIRNSWNKVRLVAE